MRLKQVEAVIARILKTVIKWLLLNLTAKMSSVVKFPTIVAFITYEGGITIFIVK